jgi:hypothetical protein
MQCSGAAASDIEVGETDTENLITDYEVAQTTDTEGDIEESTDAGCVMSKKETGTLTNTEVLREAVTFPWNEEWKKFTKKEARMILAAESIPNVNVTRDTVISNPQGKQLYIFDVSGMEAWKKHLNKDSYHWKHYSRADKSDPSMKESYFAIIGHDKKHTPGFTKRIIHFKDEDVVMIGYEGNNARGGRVPHGNSVIKKRRSFPCPMWY